MPFYHLSWKATCEPLGGEKHHLQQAKALGCHSHPDKEHLSSRASPARPLATGTAAWQDTFPALERALDKGRTNRFPGKDKKAKMDYNASMHPGKAVDGAADMLTFTRSQAGWRCLKRLKERAPAAGASN